MRRITSGEMSLAQDDVAERDSQWAARITVVLFVISWTATLAFSFVWDCGSDCDERIMRPLASVAVTSLVSFTGFALMFSGAMRTCDQAAVREGTAWSVLRKVGLVFAWIALAGMAAAFLMGAFANAGALEGLSLLVWIPSSLVTSFVMSVFAAALGGGSWRLFRKESST